MAASDAARRHVFTASLEQGQQLMEAAAVTGYAVKPILAFYGLSQLGRSMAASSCHLRDTGPVRSEAIFAAPCLLSREHWTRLSCRPTGISR
jgi:hypothetical protein